jgi:hypothetical protein
MDKQKFQKRKKWNIDAIKDRLQTTNNNIAFCPKQVGVG